MLSPSTIPVYKGDSGDWPFHFAFISFHMHNKVRAGVPCAKEQLIE